MHFLCMLLWFQYRVHAIFGHTVHHYVLKCAKSAKIHIYLVKETEPYILHGFSELRLLYYCTASTKPLCTCSHLSVHTRAVLAKLAAAAYIS